MNTSGLGEEEARRIVDESSAALQGKAGAILSFAALARLLREPDTAKLALVVEALTSDDAQALRRVYFFEDDVYGLLPVPDAEVSYYVVHGKFYHPITRIDISEEDVDDRIIIEFEVL